jgi:acetylornithine/N-succinyldiaminopimelate aminotransferase
VTTEVHDLRWPTYPGRGLQLDAAVFDDGDQPGALRVRDVDGKVYLDGVAGVGCAVLGHGHRAWADAIHRQLEKLTSVANTFYTVPQQQLAARLAELFPATSRSFFANSGTEATEAAIKLALRATGRDVIVAFDRAFHGRTLGSIALTGTAAYRDPYVSCMGEPDNRFARMNVLRLPFADEAALEQAFSEHGKRIAAVFVEPVQGEGGIWPAPKQFLVKIRELCDRHGALVGADEVQSGCGRTGRWSAWETIVGDEARPDIVWLAKALGGGFPIGACLTTPALAEHMGPGTHGTTFGGNPVACVAGLATLRLLEDEGLLAKAGSQTPTLRAIAAADPIAEVVEIRGLGAMIGVQVGAPADQRAKALGAAMIAEGVLTTTPGNHTVRLLLPYAAGEKELREFWAALRRALAATA